jgi:hypothetical protein
MHHNVWANPRHIRQSVLMAAVLLYILTSLVYVLSHSLCHAPNHVIGNMQVVRAQWQQQEKPENHAAYISICCTYIVGLR